MWPYFTHAFQSLVWVPLYLMWRYFLRLEIYGKKNLEGLKKPVIYAANHVSELDPVILPARSINPFDPLMHMFHVSREKDFYKKSFFQFIYGGTFFKLVGAYPAKVGVRDFGKSLETHVNFLKTNRNVCIFPEGRKSEDAGLLRAKGGVVYLAKATGLPIVPIAISGHFKLTPKDFFLRRRTVMLSYGKPIYPDELFEGYDPEDYHSYEEIAHKKIMTRIASLLDNHMKERLLRKTRERAQ